MCDSKWREKAIPFTAPAEESSSKLRKLALYYSSKKKIRFTKENPLRGNLLHVTGKRNKVGSEDNRSKESSSATKGELIEGESEVLFVNTNSNVISLQLKSWESK